MCLKLLLFTLMKGTYLVTFAHFFLSTEHFLVFVTFLLLVTPSALVSIDLEHNEHN